MTFLWLSDGTSMLREASRKGYMYVHVYSVAITSTNQLVLEAEHSKKNYTWRSE